MERVRALFELFVGCVLSSASRDELVVIFRGLVCGEINKDVLDGKLTGVDILVDVDKYSEFLFQSSQLSAAELELLQTCTDLLTAGARYKNGVFYTPRKLVVLSHNILSEHLGADWKNEYTVWDCAAGSRNLTKEYKFRELYSSTLDQQDIKYFQPNPNETLFQFDFLSDTESKIPAGLLDVLRNNKRLLFYINPPYSNVGAMACKTSTQSRSMNPVWRMMQKSNCGCASSDLYIQFLFQILTYVRKYSLTNIKLGVFCPVSYLSGVSHSRFRQLWCDAFSLKELVAFESSAFPHVESGWLVSFSVWERGKNKSVSQFRSKCVQVLEDGSVADPVVKDIYNFDNQSIGILTTAWLRSESVYTDKTMICVTDKFSVKNPVKLKLCNSIRVPYDFLGSFSMRNLFAIRERIPYFSRVVGALYSSLGSDIHITPSNIDRIVSAYATYFTTTLDWIDQRDYLHIPDVSHPQWSSYVSDSFVYALCHSRAWFIAKYDIQINKSTYQVPNEFFWMSRSEIADLAYSCGNLETLRTLEILPNERYVAKRIIEIESQCSDEGKNLLKALREFVKVTFKFRAEFDKSNDIVGVSAWDAGWKQLATMANVIARNQLNVIKRLRLKLSKRLQTRQYELGWRMNRIINEGEINANSKIKSCKSIYNTGLFKSVKVE
ncbi:MAG: hypothetical protein LBP59_11285 [Planctomycetaceae bacterium]|jgi:hypothetical protein|nr:hypothetical protein [Planctomycetaceae bacterium]